MAKIAEELALALRDGTLRGAAGTLHARTIAGAAQGEWSVEDVMCTSGPADASYEERHARFRIAIVAAGSFQCGSSQGLELLTPGSLMLGNVGDAFECSHTHGRGDRCLSFGYEPAYFERLAADAGGSRTVGFRTLRVPPTRELAPVVSQAFAQWTLRDDAAAWEETAVALAAQALRLASTAQRSTRAPRNAERAVTRAVRFIDRSPASKLALDDLARTASMSPYHFLRTFARLTGLTPHQYVRRARLRRAAVMLTASTARIVDVALECGFADLSSFNRAFRAEFGTSPSALRGAGGRWRKPK